MARAIVLRRVLIALNGNEGPKWFQAGDSSIYPGYVVEYEDSDEVVVMPISKAEIITGVAGLPSYHDNTTVFAAGVRVPVWLIGCGVEVWVTHDGNGSVTCRFGDPITYSDSTAGLVELDTARDIDTIGTCTRYNAITTGTKENIRIILN